MASTPEAAEPVGPVVHADIARLHLDSTIVRLKAQILHSTYEIAAIDRDDMHTARLSMRLWQALNQLKSAENILAAASRDEL